MENSIFILKKHKHLVEPIKIVLELELKRKE